MRRHPKAPSAAPISRQGSLRSPKLLLPLAAVLLLGLALSASLATAIAPTVTIEAATAVTFNSASVKGNVDPRDHETSFHFEYVDQTRFEASEWTEATQVGFSSLPEGAGPTEVPKTLSGLKPGTTYHLRLLAENADGTDEAVAPTFTTDAVNPPTVAIDPVTTFTATTAHFTGTVNSGGPNPGEVTEYRFACDPECPGLEGFQTVISNGSNQEVQGDALNLAPNIDYTVYLLAQNAQSDAEGQFKRASTTFHTSSTPPIAATGINTPGGEGGTIVTGYVNPRNSELTSCNVEYGLDTNYGQSAPCEGTLPSGGSPEEVRAVLHGLQEEVLYHFRVVATNGVGPATSEDGTFAGPSKPAAIAPECTNEALRQERRQAYLPDCRAYEMVSPADKNGGQVTLGPGAYRASDGSSSIIYDSNVPFADTRATGAIGIVTVRSDRVEGKWVTHPLLPPQEVNSLAIRNGPVLPWVSDDLSHGFLVAGDPQLVAGAPVGVSNAYLVDGHAEHPMLLSPTSNPLVASAPPPAPFAASNDLSRVVLASGQALTDDAPPPDPFLCGTYGVCLPQIYEWDRGTLRLASILPDGTPPASAAIGKGANPGDTSASGSTAADWPYAEDGSHLYFSASGELFAPTQLYLRRNGETIRVAEPEIDSPESTLQDVEFERASSNGDTAFFTTMARLVDQDIESSPSSASPDLYMYTDGPDPSTEDNLTLISEDNEPADGTEAQVLGVLGASADGSRIYFAALSQLVAGQPLSFGFKLYVWADGEVSYIATLGDKFGDTSNWAPSSNSRASRVSDDGRYLLFSSTVQQPTGPDIGGAANLYEYDTVTSALLCVSCSHQAHGPNADASVTYPGAAATRSYQYLSRAMAPDGSRVLFNTDEALVARDANGHSDAYQWTAPGVGDCRAARGCLSLLSSGRGVGNSYFADAAEMGDDIFIVTGEPLSPADHGSDRDVYDVKVEGGVIEVGPEFPGCEGDACQGPPVVLQDPTPGSASFVGPKNSSSRQKKRHRRHRKAKKHRRATKSKPQGERPLVSLLGGKEVSK